MPELKTGVASAQVSLDGAWVETLTLENASVFYPKTTLETPSGAKIRGGMHVCLPNFGPGGDSGLAQHGFGRTSTWTLQEQTANSVRLELEAQPAPYHNLQAVLRYELSDDSLLATLSVTNTGNEPLRVAPGFHPYFQVDTDETTAVVNNTTYELADIEGTEFMTADSVALKIARQNLKLTGTNLSTWAIWTDQLGDYVCVEPTLGGNRFLEPTAADELLSASETRDYTLKIQLS